MSDLDIYIIDYLQKDIGNNLKEAQEICKKYATIHNVKLTKKILGNEIVNILLQYVTAYNKKQNVKDFNIIENYVDKCLQFRLNSFQKQVLEL